MVAMLPETLPRLDHRMEKGLQGSPGVAGILAPKPAQAVTAIVEAHSGLKIWIREVQGREGRQAASQFSRSPAAIRRIKAFIGVAKSESGLAAMRSRLARLVQLKALHSWRLAATGAPDENHRPAHPFSQTRSPRWAFLLRYACPEREWVDRRPARGVYYLCSAHQH